jgi:hypothetical protein
MNAVPAESFLGKESSNRNIRGMYFSLGMNIHLLLTGYSGGQNQNRFLVQGV